MQRTKTVAEPVSTGGQTETFYRSLLESSFDGICAIDSMGVCTFINVRAARILGYVPEELLGRNFHATIHPGGQCGPSCWMSSFEPKKGDRTGEDVFTNKSGEAVPVEFAASLINGSVAEGVVIRLLQVAERRQFQAQLEQSKRIQSLGKLAAAVAHEFNNVLMSIQTFADAIKQRATDQPTLQTAAAQIAQSVTRGKRVTEEILRFARPTTPELKPIELRSLIQRLRSEIQQLVSDQVQLQIEIAEDSLYVLGDEAQLEQILVNLASNARDAMPQGGTLTIVAQQGVSYWPIFSVQSPDRYAHIRVTDSGVGITPEALDHIFEPLYKTKFSGKGTGLGLAITHQIVRMHQGQIFVESQLGKGTTFHVFIPAALPPLQQSEPKTVPLPPQRLLLVEDETPIAEGLAGLLEMEGHEVRIVNEGQKVFSAVESFSPTAVILDVGLPDIDGVELYERLSARWPELPVVFSTGHGDATKLRHHLERPHVAFLLKPYDVGTLVENLSKVLGH